MSNKTISDKCVNAVAEGFVLLEYDGMLPLKKSDKVAVFGRAQFEYIKSGSGSGGLVVCPYVTNIGDELKKLVPIDGNAESFYRDWIAAHPYDNGDNWNIPQSQKEAPVTEEFVKSIAAVNDKAIIVISRLCGEAFDFRAEKGSYYLTDEEEKTIELVCRNFKHACVLLNVGNVIDMSWVEKYGVGTVAYVWQGGQDGGAGVAQVLAGNIPPSGRLPDTIARSLADNPATEHFLDKAKNVHVEDIYVGYRYYETFARDKVLYPFGYGLSYTQFDHSDTKVVRSGDTVKIQTTVTNVGKNDGKEVVQCYVSKPQGALGKPARELVAFKKTGLLKAGKSEVVSLELNVNDLASYDDCGASGYKYAYVLENGEYGIYLGKNVRDAQNIYSFTVEKTVCVKQCRQALAPVEPFDRLVTKDGKTPEYAQAPLIGYSVEDRINNELPVAVEYTGDKNIMLQDVASGKNTMDEFIAQFDKTALSYIVRGEGMASPKAPIDGTASCFGGVTRVWHSHGVPVLTTVDGPSGVRISQDKAYATCIPTGTLLASAWSPQVVRDVYDIFAEELRDYKLDVALAPGMNIHRHPLGGRNFEYFSEDPYLTGACAAASAQSFYDNGVRCTLKHFAVNSQELERGCENEVLSERALREIYLKGFEIAVKSGYVTYIMSSYNRINGVSAASCYDLHTTILRNEWGYKGVVMTDWWTRIDNRYNESFGLQNLAAMVRAQNDVYMVVDDAETYPDDILASLDKGELTIGELQRCAENIAYAAIDSLSFKTFDKNAGLFGVADGEPIAESMGNNCKVNVNKNGRYFIKIAYSCDTDELVQNEESVLVNGSFVKTILLKGTNGKTETRGISVSIPPNGEISFGGPANISSITVYKLK